ncbi:MAG: dephospho-CoA kinase [Saprospiraceae bacterium]|nr:dephospho-CoA kinase [Saprospiraceae bacterium]
MIKIGITGGIGSGKTTVCSIFQYLSVPVYNADYEAKKLMVNDKNLRKKIIALLGTDSYKNDELNRQFIAAQIFNDQELLTKLNSYVHPIVKQDFIKWSSKQKAPYAIYEAALMIESESYKLLDKLIVVTAPMELRIDRVCQRDYVDPDKVMERIRNQMSQEEMLMYADHVITNDGKISLIKQVVELHLLYKSL